MGHTYVLFDTALATTTYVLGEFPWRVHVGEKNGTKDFIAVPQDSLVRDQRTGDRVVARRVHDRRAGVAGVSASRQRRRRRKVSSRISPSPYAGQASSMWRVCMNLLAAVILLAIIVYMVAGEESVFQHQYSYSPRAGAEASFVTDTFDVKGHPSNVEISIHTNLHNNWAYFSLALINESTGQGYDFGREVSYYKGDDSEAGSPNDSVIVPSVAPGRYYLRVEPEMAKNSRVHDLHSRNQTQRAFRGLFLDCRGAAPGSTSPHYLARSLIRRPPLVAERFQSSRRFG